MATNAYREVSAKFSPDGTRLVFSSNRSGTYCIWTMGIDGSSPFRVTTDTNGADYPSWAPDGSLIAFTSQRGSEPDTYTIAPDGTGESGPLAGQFTQWPEWSPDSTKIVVQSPVGGNWDVYSMNRDGSGITRLTTASGVDAVPFWGPGVPGYITTTTTSTTTSTTTPAGQIAPAFTG